MARRTARTTRRPKAAQKGPPDKDTLGAEARRLAKTDPSIAKKAFDAVKGASMPVLARALEGLDKYGRRATQEALFGATTDESDYFKNHKVQKFAADVLGDWTTYLTLGTAGIGRTALRTAVKGTIEKEGVALLGKEAAAELGERVFKPIARISKITGEAKTPLAAPVSTILKRLGEESPELAKQLAPKVKGGIGLGIPFRPSKRAVIVPGSVTSKITSPIAEKLARLPGVDRALTSVSPGRRMAKEGIKGLEAKSLETAHRIEASMYRKAHKALLNDIAKVFPVTAKGMARFVDVYSGEAVGTELEKTTADRLKQAMSKIRTDALAAGFEVGEIENYIPFILSKQGRAFIHGGSTSPKGSRKAPGSFLEREELKGVKTPAEANKIMREKYPEVKEFFNANPHNVFYNYMRTATDKIAQKNLAQSFLEKGIGRGSFDILEGELDVNALLAAKFAHPDDAVRAVIAGIPDARLADLAQQNPVAFKQLQEIAVKKQGELDQSVLEKIMHERMGRPKEWKADGTVVRPVLGGARKIAAELDTAGRKASAVHAQAETKFQKVLESATKGNELGNVKAKLASLDKKIAGLKTKLADSSLTPKQRKQLQGTSGFYRRQRAGLVKEAADARKEFNKVFKDAKQFVKEKLTPAEKRAEELAAKLANKAERISLLKQGIDPDKGEPWPIPKAVVTGTMDKSEWTRISGTKLGPLEGQYAPKFIAEEINKNFKATGFDAFVNQMDRTLQLFKQNVTIPFPGFHIKNLIGGKFNNYLGGVTSVNEFDFFRIAFGQVPDDKAYKKYGGLTAKELREAWDKAGVHAPSVPLMTGVSDTDQKFMALASTKYPLLRAVSGPVKGGKWWLEKNRKLAENAEFFLRGSAFLSGMDQFAGNVDAARAFVMVRHGDYGDLTAGERGLRIAIPFYKWMRTNIPLQLQSFVETPGKQANVSKFINTFLQDSEKREEFEERNYLSQFIEDRGGFLATGPLAPSAYKKVPTFISPDLPSSDINQFNPKDLLGQTTVGPLIEGITGQRLFGEGELRKVPVTIAWRPVALALHKLPGFTQFFDRTAGGELRMDQRLQRALMTANPSSRFMSTLGQIAPAPGTPAADIPLLTRLSSTLTGVRVSPVTPTGTKYAAYRAENKLQDLRDELYARGYGEKYKANKGITKRAGGGVKYGR